MKLFLTITICIVFLALKLFKAQVNTFPMNENHQHLIVVSAYKEPVALLISTIESIEVQHSAKSCLNLSMSFEERTQELTEKIMILEKRFSKKFNKLSFTSHPNNLPGEIPGKCSNANFGIRRSLAQLDGLGLDTDNIIITTCDADTKFHPEYFNALSEKFSKVKDPHGCVFQSPLLYNWRPGVNILQPSRPLVFSLSKKSN